MRQVKYERYEFHAPENTIHTASLFEFLYDIPYFGACGIFPPFHILNQILGSGEMGGGMSPGTEWEPFEISESEYHELREAVRTTAAENIKGSARYAFLQFKFDPSFDHHQSWIEWFRACCEKHRDAWHQELKAAGKQS